MPEVKYTTSSWSQMDKALLQLYGVEHQSLLVELTNLSTSLEKISGTIQQLDTDGVIRFSYTNHRSKYTELQKKYAILFQYSRKAGSLVSEAIDDPFHKLLDKYLVRLRDLSISNVETANITGVHREVTVHGGGKTSLPKEKVTLWDLFNSEGVIGNQLRDEWLRYVSDNPGLGFKEYKSLAKDMGAFSYSSIEDGQRNVEMIIGLVEIVIASAVSYFFPPVGPYLWYGLSAKEVGTAVVGVNMYTNRELSTGERLFEGFSGAFGMYVAGKDLLRFSEGLSTASKNSSKVGQYTDALTEKEALKNASGANQKVISELESPVLDGRRVESGAKVDDVKTVWGKDSKGRPVIEKEFPQVAKEHGFSDIIDNYPTSANEYPLVGGDGIDRKFFQLEGSNNGKNGVFEWIVEPNGDISHRRFIEGGVLTGKPNQIPKK